VSGAGTLAARAARDTWDVNAWAADARRLYPAIVSVHLVGSRAGKRCRPNSDWDLVVCLADDLYDELGEPVDDTEQRIAFDPALYFSGLDLYFLRPGDRQFRWDAVVEGDRIVEVWAEEIMRVTRDTRSEFPILPNPA
jgi:predicted nucleotidyltransferase